jgi:hypothetical protein
MRSNDCGLDIGIQFINNPMMELNAACINELPRLEFK